MKDLLSLFCWNPSGEKNRELVTEETKIISKCQYNELKKETAIDLLVDLLKQGKSAEISASGYSMFPTLRPGDRAIVKPLQAGEIPMKGSVVVCLDNGSRAQWRNGATAGKGEGEKGRWGDEERGRMLNPILVMHRLIDIKENDSRETMIITRGDSLLEKDEPWSQQQLLGIAVSYRRGRKEHHLKTFLPGTCRYEYNRRVLWVYGKFKRAIGK